MAQVNKFVKATIIFMFILLSVTNCGKAFSSSLSDIFLYFLHNFGYTLSISLCFKLQHVINHVKLTRIARTIVSFLFLGYALMTIVNAHFGNELR